MRIDLDNWDRLPGQDAIYQDLETNILMHSAGLGCIDPNTKISTLFGDIKVSSLSSSFFVLSEYQGRHFYSLSTAPYLKGVGDLYQVSSEQGEFVAHESHRICEHNGIYQPLNRVDLLSSRFLHRSIRGSVHSAPFLGVRHLNCKAQDFQCGYQSYIRFYGEQLYQAINNALDNLPLFFDAPSLAENFFSCRSNGLEHFEQSCDLVARLCKHIHLFQDGDHLSMQDCTRLLVVLAAALEYLDFFSTHFEHTSYQTQAFRQFLCSLEHRLKARESLLASLDKSHVDSLVSSCPVDSIKFSKKSAYYDMHVFFSNNYYAQGFFHHNSGKSHGAIRKALQLAALNQGYSGGFLCPSYSDFRKDIKPLFEQILEEDLRFIKNKHWTYHNTHKEYRFCFNQKPLYIFTAEKPIAGPNLAYCLINEFSLIPWDRINEMLRRVRVAGAQYKQKVLVGTPEDVHGWLEEFIERQEAENEKKANNFKIVFSETKENIHIDADYDRQLASMLDSQQLKVFSSGQIVKIGSDYFYYAFTREKNVHENQHDPNHLIHVGLDFNVGMMTATLSHIRYDGGEKKLFVFDEIELLGDSNTYTMRDELLSRYEPEKMLITCDASGRSRSSSALPNIINDVAILREKGLKVRFKTQNVSLRKRQILMNGLLENQRIIVDPKCRRTITDFKSVKQIQATFEKDKKNPKLTHFSDGLDYVCDFEFQLPTRDNSTKSFMGRYQ